MNRKIYAVLAVDSKGKRDCLLIGGQEDAPKCAELVDEIVRAGGKKGKTQYGRILFFKDGRVQRDKKFSTAPAPKLPEAPQESEKPQEPEAPEGDNGDLGDAVKTEE